MRVRTTSAVLILIGGVFALTAGLAQTQTNPRPGFEAASIKPCRTDLPPGGRSGGESTENSSLRLTANCMTLRDLIKMAYVTFANGHYDPLSSTPIEGGSAWINSDHYQIEAKAEHAQSQITMHGTMLQALLEERFRLKILHETREIPVYALTVAKGGLRMQQFKEGTCTPVDMVQFVSHFPPERLPNLPSGQEYCLGSNPMHGPNIAFDSRGMSVDDLCKFVLRSMDRPVIDKTGLAGRFNFHLEYLPDATSSSTIRDGGSFIDGPSDVPDGPSIFTALQQQLGLKLEPAKGPGEFLVIDSVGRPSEN